MPPQIRQKPGIVRSKERRFFRGVRDRMKRFDKIDRTRCTTLHYRLSLNFDRLVAPRSLPPENNVFLVRKHTPRERATKCRCRFVSEKQTLSLLSPRSATFHVPRDERQQPHFRRRLLQQHETPITKDHGFSFFLGDVKCRRRPSR
jgi:hypothetical protein